MRYYFDVADGERRARDDHGMDLSSDAEVQVQAMCLAHAVMADDLTAERVRSVVVTVRSTSDAPVYRASLDLRGGWTAGAHHATRGAG